MKSNDAKKFNGIFAFWAFIVAAYAIWMTAFMKDIVLYGYETIAQRTVDGIIHNDITGMVGKHWLYPVWVAFSTVFLALFGVFIKKYLTGNNVGKAMKIFSLVNLIFGCAFITWYGFFKDPQAFTASMIGLDYPWHFRMWGVFASLSVFTNTLYAYRKFKYSNRLGIICGLVGCAALFVTVNVPSAGEEIHIDSLRCMSHWSGALIFAFGGAAPIVLFLVNRCKTKNIKFIAATAFFCGILALMLIFLATVGKNGIIESLPMWAVYVLMFLINYTKVFDEKTTMLEKRELAKV